MRRDWNTRIEVTPLGAATDAFNRAQENMIDACGDQQEGGNPDFVPVMARLSEAVAGLNALGVDPYEELQDGLQNTINTDSAVAAAFRREQRYRGVHWASRFDTYNTAAFNTHAGASPTCIYPRKESVR
jgi:hypothetical protein